MDDIEFSIKCLEKEIETMEERLLLKYRELHKLYVERREKLYENVDGESRHNVQ